jgi:hypothetical protein
MQELSDWASGRGLKLDFTRTKEGFKLSNDSALELYETLNKVDSLSA